MITKFFITVNQNGSAKLTKKRQSVDFDEVSIGCQLELPDVLFKRPQIEANITVDAKDVQPFEISADTSNMVKEAIQQSTGLEVKLTVLNPVHETV
jgi:hypothetical protein